MSQANITHNELAKMFGKSGMALHNKMNSTGDKPKRFVPPQREKTQEPFCASPFTPNRKKNTLYEYQGAMKFFAQHKDWIKPAPR